MLFVLRWSTGFIGAKYVLPYAEPFTLLFLRFALALSLLAPLVWRLRPAMAMSPAERGHLRFSPESTAAMAPPVGTRLDFPPIGLPLTRWLHCAPCVVCLHCDGTRKTRQQPGKVRCITLMV